MRLRALPMLAVAFVLAAGAASGCSTSSSAGVGYPPDGEVCIGCNVDATHFDVGVVILHCQELDDAGLPICGEVRDEAAGLACQSQNGQLTTQCPSAPIGECEGVDDAGAVQWLGGLYYYGLGDAGRRDGAVTDGEEGSPTGDASTSTRAESDCHARHGTWVATD